MPKTHPRQPQEQLMMRQDGPNAPCPRRYRPPPPRLQAFPFAQSPRWLYRPQDAPRRTPKRPETA
eukprot:8993510-Pyramimonas_sp.AAC.1